jgi:hypothetical protein
MAGALAWVPMRDQKGDVFLAPYWDVDNLGNKRVPIMTIGDLNAALINPATPVLGAGENFIGQTGASANMVWADTARTRPNNATPYGANQPIGDATDCHFTFTNFFRKNAGAAYLHEVRVAVNKAAITVPAAIALSAYLYNAAGGAIADQATFTTLEAARTRRLGPPIALSYNFIGGTGSDEYEMHGYPIGGPMLIQAAAASRDLSLLLVATGTWTPVAQGIWLPGLKKTDL